MTLFELALVEYLHNYFACINALDVRLIFKNIATESESTIKINDDMMII